MSNKTPNLSRIIWKRWEDFWFTGEDQWLVVRANGYCKIFFPQSSFTDPNDRYKNINFSKADKQIFPLKELVKLR